MLAAIMNSDGIESPVNEESDLEDRLYRAAITALRSSGYRRLTKLQCEISAGVVTLSGAVPSFFLKQLAQEVVLRLAHVREVRNRVQVRKVDFMPPLDMDAGPDNDIR